MYVFAVVCLAWELIVKMAAVDCTDTKNEPVCKEHKVTRYPTVTVSQWCIISHSKVSAVKPA